MERFTQSVSFDGRLAKYDIRGSIAHASMLGRQGIISSTDSRKIIAGLKEIASEIESGKFKFRLELEDVHMNIEAALIKKIGPTGGRLHTARSRNDQVALDLRLYLKDEGSTAMALIARFQQILLRVASKHTKTIMPGYTHLQRAQPVLLAHHLLAYAEMLGRDRERFQEALKRTDVLPLGSCALAGTSLPIDRAYAARLLGFKQVSKNSMDSVSDRDFALEFLSNSAMLMTHLSRLAEEIVLWCTEEFGFITLPDAYATGSSIMPQKKNPDVAELVRAKAARTYGNLMTLLALTKALPLAYNRDLQEDKPPVFDTADTVSASLSILISMFPKIKFNKKRMYAAAVGSYSTATDIAEYLAAKGVPFREAHEITGKIVLHCIEAKKPLDALSLSELKTFSKKIAKDIYPCLSPEGSIKHRTSAGGTSPKEVARQLKNSLQS